MILRSLGAQARSQLRAYTTAASSASTSTTPKLAQLPRSTLHISGPDAQKFLKGQMCKDVDSLGGGYSGFLNASGRVLHTVFCVPVPNEPNSYLISSEANHPLPLHKLLPPFRLRAKVRIKDVSEAWDVYSAWGSEASPAPQDVWRFGNGGAAERLWSWDEGRTSLGLKEGEVGTWDLRAGWGAGGMGKLVFIPKGQSPSLTSSYDQATIDEYNLRRVALGVPEGIEEIVPGQALPLESDMDVHGGVDVRKGCYIGQELTVRTYHTGATRKRILPVRLFPLSGSESLPETAGSSGPGSSGATELTYTPPSSSASKKPRSAGKVLSLAPNSNMGMALVRLEFAERACFSLGEEPSKDWKTADVGRLTTQIGDQTYGVWVDKGVGYAAALAAMPPPPPKEEE